MKSFFFVSILCLLFLGNTSFFVRNRTTGPYTIVVTKHNYELAVYDNQGWLVTYPVVFGSRDLGDKMMAGDRETPEGTFTIISKRFHEKWDRFLLLDYPNAESYAKFNERKAEGLIPQNAEIGGGIGIHGTWPHEGYAIDQYQEWTNGCISMKDHDVEELYSMIPLGTRIIIRK